MTATEHAIATHAGPTLVGSCLFGVLVKGRRLGVWCPPPSNLFLLTQPPLNAADYGSLGKPASRASVARSNMKLYAGVIALAAAALVAISMLATQVRCPAPFCDRSC